MGDIPTDRDVLVSTGSWRATPHDYSSIRYVQFDSSGTGELAYAYGQTIYAIVQCHWELLEARRLRLTYAAVIRGRLATTFTVTDDNRSKELSYTLTESRVSGVESVVLTPYSFNWKLEFSESPWPTGLELPYQVPQIFYGRGTATEENDAPS